MRGVATELLQGLSREGHTIDCFLPAAENQSSVRTAGDEQVTFGEGELAFAENVTFVWGTSRWEWNRWYSRGKVTSFASGMVSRMVASLRLRRELARRHELRPYDLVYQFSSIETPALPGKLARSVPLVIHPETHIAGELRWLLAERRLCLRCQPAPVFAAVAVMLFARSLAQRRSIRRASLVICISSVFRDHIVSDYSFPRERTFVAPNPMRAARFAVSKRQVGNPARLLVLGRISTRKGIEDVIELGRLLQAQDADVRIRVVGGPTLWSDYTPLLGDLPSNAEYAGHMAANEIPGELAETDLLLQPSKYEPFGLTVAEALAAGVPVIGTREVGAIEGVDAAVARSVEPGDVEAMAAAVSGTLESLRTDGPAVHALARSEAERLFSPETVCAHISEALAGLMRASG